MVSTDAKLMIFTLMLKYSFLLVLSISVKMVLMLWLLLLEVFFPLSDTLHKVHKQSNT